jgi:twitching motility protein PilT
VLAQQLIPKIGGKGRALAMEVMLPNPAIRNLIREEKIQQIYSQMQVGQTKFGMQTMNQALFSLVEHHVISLEDAMERSHNPDEFRQMLSSSNSAMVRKERPARTA